MAVHLERIDRHPTHPVAARPPLLFVHGAYCAAWCWDEHFLPFFAENGWSATAFSLEGHGGSGGQSWIAILSIDEYVKNLRQIIATLPSLPILVGHSMGGFVIQRYLELGYPAAGVVLLASVPGEGMARSAIRMLGTTPDLLTALNLFQADQRYQPELDQAKRLLFSDSMPEEELAKWAYRFTPESMRAILDMTLVSFFSVKALEQIPALVLGGDEDKIISPSEVVKTARRLHTEAEIVGGCGHMMMLDTVWQEVAQRILEWLSLNWPTVTEPQPTVQAEAVIADSVAAAPTTPRRRSTRRPSSKLSRFATVRSSEEKSND